MTSQSDVRRLMLHLEGAEPPQGYRWPEIQDMPPYETFTAPDGRVWDIVKDSSA